MNNINTYYDDFLKRLHEIKVYIDCLEVQKSIIREYELPDTLNIISNNSKEFENSVNYIAKIRGLVNSPVQYNALIISIYGCFENYIDNIFKEFINILCFTTDNYKGLSEKIRNKHLKKLGDFLTNPQRYSNYELTPEEAVKNLYIAMENNTGSLNLYQNSQLITSHGGNLRIGQITDLMQELGIEMPHKKIVNNFMFQKYHKDVNGYTDDIIQRYSQDYTNLFIPLDKLVTERNNVSHGWVETRIAYNIIKDEIIHFVECLGKILKEIIINETTKFQLKMNKMDKFLKVFKVIDNHIVLLNSSNAKLHIGDYILIEQNGEFMTSEIINIEVDNVKHTKIESNNIDIGIEFEKRVDKKIKKTDTFYYFK